MSLEDAEDLVLHMILSKVGPENTARVACVSKRLQVSASEESLWSIFCSLDLNISTPLHDYIPMEILSFLQEATLRKGVTEDDLEELETALNVQLPLTTRLLYRFVDGQELSSSSSSAGVDEGPLGLIGGYSAYWHKVNVYLLPLKEVVRQTIDIMAGDHNTISKNIVVVAVSAAPSSKKMFFLDCTNGQLYTENTSSHQMLPCVPESLVCINGDQQQDAMLLWLEEHGRRLQTGATKVREQDNIKSISLFPEIPPLCSIFVTNGVQVRASSVFMPEVSNHLDNPPVYSYACSIRMSLMPNFNRRHRSSWQMYSRHWVVRADDAVIGDVDGEVVLLKNPLLQAKEEEFVYRCISQFPTSNLSVEGSFTFVPGSLQDPKEPQFEVNVAEFPVKLPDYIF
ncbi:hypothetical protein IGI04_040231 [Brassica rapa subsp. trilocularis]|uniref:ApaG domain-containing protein n=2 Tax=Brassica campestris TaxID=3711 RepID=M4DG51_BRACM|nr:hypothetical protein IGI04_040231 [Brassica rapa subsp. trilocularis]